MNHTNWTSPLPPSYDGNTLVALVQGPGVVYVYWELSPEFWDLLTTGGEFALRLYQVSRNESVLLEEVLPDWRTGNWYFRNVNDGVEYRCELGRREGDRYYSYLSSEVVATPREEVVETVQRQTQVPVPFKTYKKDDQPGSSGFGPEGEG
ncbi:MAG: DUF4912 domain-containing protein [Clostridia bacterium]|nr:DUF4912 domain-containing protein [Clostridia bacterium]MDQ7791628.1 DUF4912 domain-containing protein [Clostridia bacterium]